MNHRQVRIRSIASVVVVLLVAAFVASCTSAPEEALPPPDVSAPGATLGKAALGDSCADRTGDMLGEVEGEAALSEPTAIDIVKASAAVTGDELVVTLTTVGSIEAALDPLFLVQQGDVSRAANVSFELRAVRGGGGTGDWEVRLITFTDGKESRSPSPLSGVDVVIEGNTLTYAVPLRALPAIATLVWQFGTSAGVSDENRVFDECEPFAQPPDLVPGTVPLAGPGATAAAPTIPGKVGETVEAPDGSTLTVLSINKPPQPNRTVLVNPIPGNDLAAIEVKVCASDRANLERVGEKRFSVQMTDGRSFDSWQAPDHTNDPTFPLETSLRPGECAQGWISYEVPEPQQIVSVTYDAGGRSVGPYIVVSN